jgi:hypothetical protein
MLLDATRTNVVAAWPRQARTPKASEQSAEKQNRRAHSPPQVVSHIAGLGGGLDGE